MSHDTADTTPTGAMEPEDVPAELVELALDETLPPDGSPGLFDQVAEHEMRQALAAVLPVYGSQVLHRAGYGQYTRMEELARSLTARAYGSALLFRLADEAQTVATAGIEPELNTKLADLLRQRARREGNPS